MNRVVHVSQSAPSAKEGRTYVARYVHCIGGEIPDTIRCPEADAAAFREIGEVRFRPAVVSIDANGERYVVMVPA
jgi:hypothetical protein